MLQAFLLPSSSLRAKQLKTFHYPEQVMNSLVTIFQGLFSYKTAASECSNAHFCVCSLTANAVPSMNRQIKIPAELY